ncbi:di-heme-cytochrome C peroxidase [Azospirillum sp. sgz301742]
MAFRTIVGVAAASLLFATSASHAQDATAAASKPVAQGWTAAQQAQFYTEDQGSRMIPLRWLQALKQSDHKTPFLADSLARYGYLPNMNSPVAGLPVGFSAPGGDRNDTAVGMTCASCHTREIRISGTPQRIDGGPAITDFFAFMTDLDAAITYALGDGWVEFAQAVPEPQDKSKLRQQVLEWAIPFHTLMSKALSGTPWGLSRLDAVSMIFNRLTGLDLGDPKNNYLIPSNIQPAVAPVRYPFLWNAGKQDKTQWPGFTNQSSALAPLGRNIGEVFGVFAHFNPKKSVLHPILKVDYWNNNSVQIDNLKDLEGLITVLTPPAFPAPIDPVKANQGQKIYYAQCKGCHDLPTSTERASWTTPVQNVGTDGKEWEVMARTANPGALTGASIPALLTKDPGVNTPLKNGSASINVLQVAVLGTVLEDLLQALLPTGKPGDQQFITGKPTDDLLTLAKGIDALAKDADSLTETLNAREYLKNKGIDTQSLAGLMKAPKTAGSSALAAAPSAASSICDTGYNPPCYESRVLRGIWAAAPYLHNGSVPTLWDLLMPAAQRPATFEVGADYDVVNVGLAKTQTGLKSVTQTTGCTDAKSGNSRCGHEFGTTLSNEDKWALVEFLKGL